MVELDVHIYFITILCTSQYITKYKIHRLHNKRCSKDAITTLLAVFLTHDTWITGHQLMDLIRMVSSGMLRRVALVRTNVSEELSA
jgi:hypothetical protein